MTFFTCTVCNVEQPTNSVAATVIPNEAKPNDVGYCCLHCAMSHDGQPGKYEGEHGIEDIGTVLVLAAWALEGGEDDYMNAEGWGYCGQFGRFLLFEDDRGSVTFRDCRTVERASEEFSSYYSEGWGYSEDDAQIEGDRNGYSLYVERKHIGTYPRLTRARAAMRLHAIETGYYPNLWLMGERGDLSILNY
jgi:hypothetical protein